MPWHKGSESDLTEISIEDLMEQKVTSVSKTEQAFSDTAATVFVITQDDLRRSGVTNIPEALRMVPGLQVARIDMNEWTITARGFNGRFANKLLVLIDGRTVYMPAFSGVYWETQDLVGETAIDATRRGRESDSLTTGPRGAIPVCRNELDGSADTVFA